MKLFFSGGLNEQQNPSLFECGEGYNFELGLRQSKLIPRSPIDLKGTATNASDVAGFLQLVKTDNTETTLVQAGASVFKWDGSLPPGGYLNLPGSAGDYASTPDAAALDITGDIEIIVYVAATDWTPAAQQDFLGKWATAGQSSYRLFLRVAGTIAIETSNDGTATVTNTSTVSVSFANGSGGWIRATLDVDDGAGNRVAKFYTSTDAASTAAGNVSWTQLGATVTTAGTTSLFSSTSILEIGSILTGTNGNFNGKIYSAYVYNGIGGTLVANFNGNDAIAGATTSVSSGTGETYTKQGNASFTGKFGTCAATSQLRDTYWSLGDYLVITDLAKATVVKKWDGTTFSTLTTGLGSSLYAKYGVVHNNRVWLANVTTSSATPHMVVASAFEDPTSYDTTARGTITTFTSSSPAFYLLSPDLKPINWMGVFQNVLLISTEGGRLYKLTGTTPSDYTFTAFYMGSAATGTESAANIGNDVIYLKGGGGIDLLSSTQNFGDVAADDVSRWIPTTTKGLSSAIVIYEQFKQKVYFFVTGKVLVLFKDLMGAELSPWSVYTTQLSFGFNIVAAKYMKVPGTQNYTTFISGTGGTIYDMNGTGAAGDGGTKNIQIYRKTRYIYSGEGGDKFGHGALNLKKVMDGIVTYRRVAAACSVTIGFDWGDEYNVSTSVITLKGSPTASAGNYYGGTIYYSGTSDVAAYYSLGNTFAKKISSQTFSPSGKGPGCFVYVSLETSTQFQIDSVELQPPKT